MSWTCREAAKSLNLSLHQPRHFQLEAQDKLVTKQILSIENWADDNLQTLEDEKSLVGQDTLEKAGKPTFHYF